MAENINNIWTVLFKYEHARRQFHSLLPVYDSVSQNVTALARYKFDKHQPILNLLDLFIQRDAILALW